MSMSAPLEPQLPSPGDDGIPAADAGNGAPPPAEGFGVAGEEPDAPPSADGETGAARPADTHFRTPDPREVGPDPG